MEIAAFQSPRCLEKLDREVFVLGDDGVAYREKLWRVPGFSIQAQRGRDAPYSTEQLQEVGASWLEDEPYGETHEHQRLQRTVTWGHGIYQTNG